MYRRLQTSVTINTQLKVLSSFSANFHLWHSDIRILMESLKVKMFEIFLVLSLYARRMNVILKFAPKSVAVY